ncbi:MAG: dihydropteroate synthase [Coriobacteriia bacterium]|nr:dihydropteroate synthase [Coriobacteriia bacterium]
MMGILNVTPDSFSDGGSYFDPVAALEHGRELAADGADIIDVGGESTRPGSDQISPGEESSRVCPVLKALARDFDVPLSIDSRHPEVVSRCMDAGASIINDVSGFRDPAMVALAVSCDAGVVVMHMLGEPKTMQAQPVYEDVLSEVRDYLVKQAVMLEEAGVERDRIAIDPGIGFGKTTEHNIELLRGLPELVATGYPVVVGASRKRFIGELTEEPDPAHRVPGSLAAAAWSALHGASVLRVHDIKETAQAFGVWAAIEGDWL